LPPEVAAPPAVVELEEAGDPVTVALDDQIVDWLVEHRMVAAQYRQSGEWELTAARKVGVVRVGDVTLRVTPKVAVSRLVWMLGWAQKAGWQSGGPVELDESADLVAALAEAFARQAERALQRGLLYGYKTVDADLAVLRGRIRTDDQLRRRFGLPVPLAVRFGDHLADIAENQILRAAATRLLRLPGVGLATRARLRSLRALLEGVADLPGGRPWPVWRATRLNARYHDALRLAEVVLASRAFEVDPGRLRVDGFMVDMYQLFEDFVTATLSTALQDHGGRCTAQDRHSLDDEELIPVRPDLLWRVGGHIRAVVDAKYKAEKLSGFPQSDLYQVAAYATAYGLDRAHLVYAKGHELARSWTVRNSGVRITAHALDLESPPALVLASIRGVANQIAA
jgi:5-methylcytosine-specific restriction enzyme subunit McrC